MRAFRYLYRLPLFAWHVLIHLPLTLLLIAIGNGGPLSHGIVRWWAGGLLRVFGMRVQRVGTPLPGGTLFVANHVSWIDIMALHSQHMMGFIAKSEIRRWPVVGWVTTHAETIFLQRGNGDSLGLVMDEMAQRLRDGRAVGGVPRGRHPRRPRARRLPCPHLHRRGGGRRAGAAGGAVLRRALRSASDRRVRPARAFHRQPGAPARRTAATACGCASCSRSRRASTTAAAASPGWRANASCRRWPRPEAGACRCCRPPSTRRRGCATRTCSRCSPPARCGAARARRRLREVPARHDPLVLDAGDGVRLQGVRQPARGGEPARAGAAAARLGRQRRLQLHAADRGAPAARRLRGVPAGLPRPRRQPPSQRGPVPLQSHR